MDIKSTSVTGSGTAWLMRVDRDDGGYSVREFRTRQAAEIARQDFLRRTAPGIQAREDLRRAMENPTYSKPPGASHRTGDR
jgi:hypothetical protein